MSILTEKQVLCDFLETYKCLPCLWDQSDRLYTSKVARDQAYQILLEKFRPIQDDASIQTIKKKIEHMRSAYRRETKKVLETQLAGVEYKPKLWYYDKLTFLEKEWPSFAEDSTKPHYSSGDEEETQLQSTSSKLIYEDEPKKRQKVKNDASYVELHKEDPLTETVAQDNFTSDDMSYEADSFGRTVGLQLKQLNQMQRTIAEKLISEVIFYGRLDKLTLNSMLNLNEYS